MDQAAAQTSEVKKVEPRAGESTTAAPSPETQTTEEPKKSPCKKHRHSRTSPGKSAKSKKQSKKEPSSESSSSSSSSESEEESSDSDSDSSVDASVSKRKQKEKKAKAAAKKLKAKNAKNKKKRKQSLKQESSDSDESDESDEEAEQLQQLKRNKAKAKAKARRDFQGDDDVDAAQLQQEAQLNQLLAIQMQANQRKGLDTNEQARKMLAARNTLTLDPGQGTVDRRVRGGLSRLNKQGKPSKKVVPLKKKRASKVAYKRVDQLWDQSIHNYKLTETVPDHGADEWDQYIFTVRRKFDWEHKYQETLVDIKSKPLKESLQHVMVGVKGISLVQETPHIDPNMLFLYLEECRVYMTKMEEEGGSAKKKKDRKAAATKAKHLGILIKYLDKDYAETKKTLYPMLERNMISFDLLWALFKPNSIAYTTTYGDTDHPRAFKIDYATKESHFMKGTWYNIEGKYLEYDGKSFGMGNLAVQVPSFQGVRRISSLECYPLQYHKDADSLKAELIERGKKFVALEGVQYKYHKGMAFTKRKRQILKININGRIMCDPAIHRRINPNYQISNVKAKEADDEDVFEVSDSEDESGCGCGDDSSEEGDDPRNTPSSSEEASHERRRFRVVKTPDGRTTIVEVDPNEETEALAQKDRMDTKQGGHAFTEEELLIASPVVLGFAFSEKLWLEFTVSGISEVIFNEDAFEQLVLPDNQKSIVKALVSSHAFHPSKSIDDIISGKGRGLCCVLHGPPGTGKTLTAEGIADLLKCPLYMVSAGDLGTDPRNLEKELQSILDIAHSWGAILLLDEADVFLEKRSIHDTHRNALVSIFLRLLEYFQGILFLTTNRVETFDEAFVSRIHLSLRYEELSTKARHRVWKLFLEKVRSTEGVEIAKITEGDYMDLARRDVNGRQIKNLVRAAQALAVHESRPLSMAHIKRVIDVAESFERDLKGGTGYSDAMRSKFKSDY